MPKEIKTTIAVDGEAAFKRAINDATTSIRNMGTQLTLAQAKFKQDGDAMKLMETRSKALKGEIGQQEEIVKALEKAVEDSAKAYGEGSDKAEKWQAELNRAKAHLANLQSELTLNEQGLDRNGKAFDDSAQKAADYQATLQGIGRNVSFETITNGINGVTSLVSSAIEKVIDLGTKITQTMREAAQWADDLITESIVNELSVEDMQRMQYASKFADTSVDTIIKARDRLNRKMKGEWKNSEGNDLWKILGIDTSQDSNDVFWNLGEKLMWINDLQKEGRTNLDADVLANDVFGKSWRELLPLFTFGRQAFEEKMSEAPVVSEEDVEKLGSLNDKFDEFDSRLTQLKETALAQLAPAMESIVDSINNMLASFSEWMSTEEGKKAMDDLAKSIESLFSGLGDVDFSTVVEKVKGAINGIKDALVWLNEHKDDVVTALGVIAGGFAALKVSQLALSIGMIVSGFQKLWAGANNPLPQMPGTGNGTQTPVPTGTSTGTGKNMPANAALLTDGVTMFDTKLGQAGAVGVLYQMNAMLREEFDEKKQELEQLTEENGWDETARNYWMLTGKKPEIGTDEYKEWEAAFNGTAEPKKINEAKRSNPISGLNPEDIEEIPLGYSNTDRNNAVQDWWDAHRNVLEGLEDQSEEDSAFNWMIEVFGNEFSDVFTSITEKLNELDGNQTPEDIPEDWWKVGADSALNDAVAEMKINTGATKTASDKIASADFKKFNSLPGDIQRAAQAGTAAGVSGIQVHMDGSVVGRLTAPYVSAIIASNAQ